MLSVRANDNLAAVAYVNCVGGQDELAFDGASLVIKENGEVIARAKQFEEDFLIADIDLVSIDKARLRDPRRRQDKHNLDERTINELEVLDIDFKYTEHKPRIDQRIETALPKAAEVPCTCTEYERLHHQKWDEESSHRTQWWMDSSLVACIAVDALGKDNVIGVSMPGPFSSEHSKEDARLYRKTSV